MAPLDACAHGPVPRLVDDRPVEVRGADEGFPSTVGTVSRSERWSYPRGVIAPPDDLTEGPRPLQLYERGVWDPAEYWGEPDGMLEICLVEVIAAGPRLQHEFEQLLPGGEDPGAPDPILEAVELRERSQPARAGAARGIDRVGPAVPRRLRPSWCTRVRG